MDIPNAESHREASQRGYLQKLSSRSFPYIPHPWKKRYCVLTRGHLYYYEREDARGTDKGAGVINLEYYDQVLEASAKECKKATNVFVLTSQDRSFFDPGRHLFSADSPHAMNDWIRLLKRAIEQIRTTAVGATASSRPVAGSNPSSPRPAIGGPQKAGKQERGSKDKARRKEEEAAGSRRRGGEQEEATVENKENVEDWNNSKDTKQKYSETSLRRRRANPSSRSMDETSVAADIIKSANTTGRKKPEATPDPNSASSSLGRKQQPKGKSGQGSKPPEFQYASSDLEGMMFGSLGRQLKGDKEKGSGADSGGSSAGSNVERRKRKADDDEDGAADLQTPETAPQLESVTKHRVKGPAGRRMPQHRRTQHLKHRASSLSALAHSEEQGTQDSPSASFVPWLNRSLDLLEDDSICVPSRNSQPTLAFLYSDPEDPDENEEQVFEYNIGFTDDNLTYEENSGLFVQDGQFIQTSDSYGNMNLSSTSGGGMPPPLPPRMESRIDFPGQQIENQFLFQQHQKQLQHQMQLQATFQQQNQQCSPFGTTQKEVIVATPFGTRDNNFSDRELKAQHRKSQPVDGMEDIIMTRSFNNELFIASYSEDNSREASNPQINHTQQHQNQQQMQFGAESIYDSNASSTGKQQKQLRQKSGSRQNGQKIKKPVAQPDINRFTVAVRNLQKHVVELDQAVNEITKEVEDSKTDFGSIKSGLVGLRKDKDRLNDAVSVINQEATKMREQVSATMKETEKLQKTATAALVVAEKAKMDQINLKREYECMIKELKTTIDNIKRDALKNTVKNDRNLQDNLDEDIDSDNHEMEEEKEMKVRKTKQIEQSQGSSSKICDSKYDSKSSGYQSFFSRPSSIISGLTNLASMSKSSSINDVQEKDKNKDGVGSPKKDKDRSSKEKVQKSHSKSNEKKPKKEKQCPRTDKLSSGSDKDKGKKYCKNLSEDFPMMDDTGSSRALSPIGSDVDITEEEFIHNTNFNLGKSISSPTVPSRPRMLNLKAQNSDVQRQTSSIASSPDSPTRPVSPFDIPKVHLNGRATSPIGFPLHRPGSTPGPLVKQGSMTTVPEDRAVDSRCLDNRPSDPPPPPPSSRVFAISRQNSSPNISTQKSSPQPVLHRQHSLGVVVEESKNISRQASLMSVPDDRLIVDRTLPMSPTQSMLSFPGCWSTTSLNRPDSNVANGDGFQLDLVPKDSPRNQQKGALETVAGGVLSGSSLQAGTICPLDMNDEEPPLATSSLKRRKKAKKDPEIV